MGKGFLLWTVKCCAVSLSFIYCDTVAQQKVYSPDIPATGILTPAVTEAPRLNSAPVFAVRPGSPFLYFIPASGNRPVQFTANALPAGLNLDARSGKITGRLPKPGRYEVTLQVKNRLGKAAKPFTIIVGEDIALTPPMGWNSYNVYGEGVDEEKATRAAKALVSTRLNEHGWVYINMDDGWQGERDPKTLALQPDPGRFRDMRSFVNGIHALGLKAGLYSSPWTKTYGGRTGGSAPNADGTKDDTYLLNSAKNKKVLPFAIGKYSFAKHDAAQFADWQFDYLKYDWGPVEGPETREMHNALRDTHRDIVFSLSNNHVMSLIRNIKDVAPYAEAWRTTTDINDNWKRVSDIGFNQDQWAPFSGPGHFIDPDMLVVGYVGWRDKPRLTRLTKDEQYTHISLWCMLSAPLLLGCDLEKMDEFTAGLLTNDEVIEIDQDALGKQGVKVYAKDSLEVFQKPLQDGSIAVGLFNRRQTKANISVKWEDLHIQGQQLLRDLWRQKNIGVFEDNFEAEVTPHGVIFVKISQLK